MLRALSVVAALRNFIKVEAIKATGADKFPCVKQEVFACLIQVDGTMSFGSNAMATTISLCPRVQLGISGYEPCADMCHQGPEFHAERQAIWNAYYENDNLDLTGAVMFITGHVVCCDTCCQAMFDEGIVYAGSLDSGRYYERGETTMKESVRCPECGLKVCACDDISELLVANMCWHKTRSYKIYACCNNGSTFYNDIWHRDGKLFESHHITIDAYNIYNEPTSYKKLVDKEIGFTWEEDGKTYGARYGAYTAIELIHAPNIDYIFDGESDLDELL